MGADLIGDYVATLHRRLAWRSDVVDITDEVEDHLREHCDRLVERGADPVVAQRETLGAFGDPGLVAHSFAESATGALALPTRATRLAGFAGVAAAAFWVAAGVSAVMGGMVDGIDSWTAGRYLVWAPSLECALVTSTATLAGALARSGRLRTRASVSALSVMSLVSLVLAPMTWAVFPVLLPLAVAVLVALHGHCGEAEGIVRPLRLLAVWVPALAVFAVLAHVVPVGPLDESGQRPYAVLTAFALGASVSAVATARVGMSLAREHPVDLGPSWPPAPLAR